MGGGLLQLVAYGAQDVYLTGNPQITFFKVVYRRHTNFALESIQQTFNGTVAAGSRVTSTISRNGDLINRMYLVADMTNAKNWDGLKLIKSVELEIGGQKIDKQYGEWMYIWNELSLPVGKQEGYKRMVAGGSSAASGKFHIPLEFWFCRNVGLALPLIALQYHEVKVNIELGAPASPATLDGASLWVDYIYLDTDERRKFAQSSHEYLIEQLQFTGSEGVTIGTNKVKLNFNHPVKELVWTIGNNPYVYNNGVENPVRSAKLVLNGNDRFAEREGKYFDMIQPYQHHENIPTGRGINVYSFALKPEEHQPSGTLNMSRIDTAVLNVTSDIDGDISVYAVNYNVLRILSGMGGIAYSN
jgi:hypothetical protein